MTPRLVAFTGAAGSGKSAAAAVLVERGWQVVAVADVVREALHAAGAYPHDPADREAWDAWKRADDLEETHCDGTGW